MEKYDVVVVGAGNAALSSALASKEQGAKVLVLEKGSKHERGGNSFFTDGAIRFAFDGINDLKAIIPDINDEVAEKIHMPPYTKEEYYADIMLSTHNKSDPKLAKHIVDESYNTIKWLRDNEVEFDLIYDNQSFFENGIHHFWGGLPVRIKGRGVGLIDQLNKRIERVGIEVRYDTPAIQINTNELGEVESLIIREKEKEKVIKTKSVILACGSFEGNRTLRAKKMGKDWEHAILRGSEHNTGDGLYMAVDVGAQPFGDWSMGHAIGTDSNAPNKGDFTKPGDIYKKHSYPLGILLNKEGERFVDEGANFRNYTYAKYGREILRQTDQMAYQIFDQQVRTLLRDEYDKEEATCYVADTLERLVSQLDVNQNTFLNTIKKYNQSVQKGVYKPFEKDGKGTKGITPPKTNWSLRIEKSPFYAYPVTCGLTFCFGGIKANTNAEVLNFNNEPINGLYAAGEMIGGIFYHNYPGGTGLMSGAVFGKKAGTSAARYIKK